MDDNDDWLIDDRLDIDDWLIVLLFFRSFIFIGDSILPMALLFTR